MKKNKNMVCPLPTSEYFTREECYVLIANKLIENANKKLPKNTYYELRIKIPMSYGEDRGMAWCWYKGIPHEILKPDFKRIDGNGAYFLYARFKTGMKLFNVLDFRLYYGYKNGKVLEHNLDFV